MQPDTPDTPAAPRGHAVHSPEIWDAARRDYVAGESAEQVCWRYGLKERTFWDHARDEGWRRCDQPDAPPLSDDDPEADQPVDCAALAADALVQVRRALRLGRAGEAGSWMRLHEKLLARIEADGERERRRERVARAQGSGAADEALANALKPLRERMAYINTLGVAQVRVGRAWSQGHLSTEDYHRFTDLHTVADEALEREFAAFDAAKARAAPPDPHGSHPDFSAASDP
ncbi:hypothetical protein [Brevundimonas sp. GCM10030266]|uniref:hypothetical protein n=1 Tax=Brevundimonas sp. GCM10030266 TaxID=3273386 RepID=UPI003607730C